MKFVTAIFAFLVGASAIANAAVTCGDQVRLYDNSSQLSFASAPDEAASTPFLMIGGDRFAVGTHRVEKSPEHPQGTFRVTGGRLVVQQIAESETLMSVEPPSLSGKPSHLGALHVSPDGTYMAVTGATRSGGGPVAIYETGAVELLHNTEEVQNSWDPVVHQFIELHRLAEKANPLAIAQLKQMDPTGSLMKVWKADPEGVKEWAKNQASRLTNVANQSRSVPVMGMQFHPSSETYLSQAADHVSIRRSRTGKEIQRIILHSLLGPIQNDQPRTYFVDRGNAIAAISREHVTFWDAEEGSFLGSEKALGELGGVFDPIVPATSGQFVSAAYKTETARERVLYSIHRNTQTKEAKPSVEKVYKNSLTASTAPGIAFGPNEYAVGIDGKRVEIHSSEDHSLLWEFETSGELGPHLMNYSNDGHFLAVASADGKEQGIELWSTSKKAGLKFNLEEKPYRRVISSVNFSADGSWLTVTVMTFEDGPDKPYRTEAYAIDIFRQMAKLKPAAK